jgi:hypothetical protein
LVQLSADGATPGASVPVPAGYEVAGLIGGPQQSLVILNSPFLRGMRVAASGAVLDPVPRELLLGRNERRPAVASSAAGYLAAWEAGTTIRAARFDAQGQRLDATALAVSAAGQGARVAFDGTGYFVAWFQGNSVSASRVSTAGAIAPPVTVGAGTDPAVASGGGTTLVVWNAGDIVGVRLAADGTVLDATPLQIGVAQNAQLKPAVSFGGGVFLVAWADQRNDATTGVAQTFVARVTPAGAVLDPGGLPLTAVGARDGAHAVASDGNAFLVSWLVNSTVMAMRVGADGSLLDGAPRALASSSVSTTLAPASAFDGATYVVGWPDQRGVFAARMTPAGGLLDPSAINAAGFPVSVDSTAATEVAIASQGNGRSMIAYARALAVKQRVISNLPGGAACAAPDECASAGCQAGTCAPISPLPAPSMPTAPEGEPAWTACAVTPPAVAALPRTAWPARWRWAAAPMASAPPCAPASPVGWPAAPAIARTPATGPRRRVQRISSPPQGRIVGRRQVLATLPRSARARARRVPRTA